MPFHTILKISIATVMRTIVLIKDGNFTFGVHALTQKCLFIPMYGAHSRVYFKVPAHPRKTKFSFDIYNHK